MLDWWIVAMFLFITLVVGVWQGKGMTTLRAFSIAEKKYSTSVLVATITATFLSGGAALGVPEKTFKYGIVFFLVSLGDVLKTLIQARFIAPNVDKYNGCISVGDMMGKSYGKGAKLFTGIAGTLTYITLLGAQISAIGYVFYYFLGISHFMGVLIGCGIVIIYSTFGGVKAVTITDVIQFIVLIVAIPIICNVGIAKVGGYNGLFDSLSTMQSNLFLSSKIDVIKNIELFLIFLLSITGPASIQRLLMAQNGTQASRAFYYTALICLLFFSLVCLIGLSAKVLKPDLDPVLAMPYIIESLPIGFRGLAIAGLIAIIMSTADSALNTASILLVNDVILVFTKKKLNDLIQLKLAQILTVFIGVFSIAAAFSFKSVLDIVVLSKLFWTPMIVIPFITSVIGFRVEYKSFWIGIFSAGITALLWQSLTLEKSTGLTSTLPAMLANAMFFFGSHYYYKLCRPEKFNPIPSLSTESTGSKKKSLFSNLKWNNIANILRKYWIKAQNFSLVEFAYRKVSHHGASYQLFAAFTVLSYLLFTDSTYPNFLLLLKFISGVLCVGLFFAPELTRKYSKPFFSLYWYFTLMFALPFISFSMVILHNGELYWLLNMAVSIFFLALLTDWVSFILIILVGLVSSSLVIKFYLRHLNFILSGYQMLLAIYMVFSSIIISIFFSYRRESFIEQRLETMKALGGTIAHELRTPLSALIMRGLDVAKQSAKLLDIYKTAKNNNSITDELHIKEIQNIETSYQSMDSLSKESLFIIDMLLTKLKDPIHENEKEICSMKETLQEAINKYPLYEEQKILIKLDLEEDFEFYGNKTMFCHVIFNLLKNALYYISYANRGEITIKSQKGSQNYNLLYFKDTARGIQAESLSNLFKKFYSKTNHGTGLGLAFCKSTMEELGGDIQCRSVYGEYTEFILFFPVKSSN